VLATELVQKYAGALTNNQLLQIIEEIESTLDRYSHAGQFCGSPLDHKHWREGIVLLRSLFASRGGTLKQETYIRDIRSN